MFIDLIKTTSLAKTANFHQKANRLHSLALRQLGNFRKGTPTAGLEVMLDLMPLDTYIEGEMVMAFRRQSIN